MLPETRRMPVDLGHIDQILESRPFQDPKSVLPAESLDTLIRNRSLVVLTNWSGSSVDPRHDRYAVGRTILSVGDVLQIPHRLTILSRPVAKDSQDDNYQALYFLLEAALADQNATLADPRESWEPNQRRGLFLLGLNHKRGMVSSADYLTELNQKRTITQLQRALESRSGTYGYLEPHLGFRLDRDRTTIVFNLDLAYPPNVAPSVQESVNLHATEYDPRVRVIPVITGGMSLDLAKEITEANSSVPQARGGLFT